MATSKDSEQLLEGYRDHDRGFEDFLYAYPVLSRRARGMSLGLNLSPHKACNFDCLYCQVDRSTEAAVKKVSMERLGAELSVMLKLILSGEIFTREPFASAPQELQRLNDIALSGDGEPTSEPVFEAVCDLLAGMKKEGVIPEEVKIVVITNGTRFHIDAVERGLSQLDSCRGEVWAKFDAGTAETYQKVDKSRVPFRRIVDNLILVASRRPVKIQTLFFELEGEGPSSHEIEAYCGILEDVLSAGGKIIEVQLHTVARKPMNHIAEPLSSGDLEAYAKTIRDRLSVEVVVYPGLKG